MTQRPSTPGVVSLAPRRAAQLRGAELTAPWDATAPDAVPPGFRAIDRTAPLARLDLDGAGDDLQGWWMHTRAGIEVATQPDPGRARDARPHDRDPRDVRPGDVIELRLGMGPFRVCAPCRILEVFDEPDRRGLTYGTLPGHPESGIERFEVLRAADGSLRVRLSGFSRPGSPLVRVGAPVARIIQEHITRRYLRALDEL